MRKVVVLVGGLFAMAITFPLHAENFASPDNGTQEVPVEAISAGGDVHIQPIGPAELIRDLEDPDSFELRVEIDKEPALIGLKRQGSKLKLTRIKDPKKERTYKISSSKKSKPRDY